MTTSPRASASSSARSSASPCSCTVAEERSEAGTELNLRDWVPEGRVRRCGAGVDAAWEERAEAVFAVTVRPDGGG